MREEETIRLINRIEDRFLHNNVKTFSLDQFPESDVDFIELPNLSYDISQGTGNVIIRYFYFPSIDAVGEYADF